MKFLETGYLDINDIKLPSGERFSKGPVAVIECVQQIPCNPCVDACPRGAITMGDSINNLPVVDFDKCNGCSLCVANCPGLAIFIVDRSGSEGKAVVGMPYEFLPLPEKEEEVILLNRTGEECGTGVVKRIRNSKAQDRTPVIFIEMNDELALNARFFRRKPQ